MKESAVAVIGSARTAEDEPPRAVRASRAMCPLRVRIP